MGDRRRIGRRRTIVPDRVDRVVLDRHQRGARLRGRFREALQAVRRVQPRVVADPRAVGEGLGDPIGRWLVRDVARREGLDIHLVAHLKGVAPVDEDRGAVARDADEAGGAGEPGQPLHPFRIGGHVLAHEGIGARGEESVQLSARQLLAQGREPFRRRRHDAQPARSDAARRCLAHVGTRHDHCLPVMVRPSS
jgi:hypothetical protein